MALSPFRSRTRRSQYTLAEAPPVKTTPVWAWTLVPFGLLFVMFLGPLFLPLEGIVGLAIAAFIPYIAARRPFPALLVLIVALPFHTLTMALFFKLGVPAQLVRQLTYWKELVVIGLVIAAAIRFLRDRPRLDFVDWIGLAFVGLTALFLIFPRMFIGDGPLPGLSDRVAGFRGDVFYIVLFMAARHLRLAGDEIRRLLSAFIVSAMVVAGICCLEFFSSSTWNMIATEWFDVQLYKYVVLELNPFFVGPISDVRVYGFIAGRQFVRVGGPEIAYAGTAFYLVTAIAVAFERFTRTIGIKAVRTFLPIPLLGFALLVTQTRSAIASAALVVGVILITHRGRAAIARVRSTALVSVILLAAISAAFAIGVTDRFAGDQSSDAAHDRQLSAGWEVMWDNPLGTGLATAAGAGIRSGTGAFIIPESQYLQVGVQFGLLGLLIYLAFWLGSALRLHLAPRMTHDEDALWGAAAMRDALAALLFGSYFLHSFVTISSAWVTWGLAGAALGAVDHARHAEPHPDDEPADVYSS